MGEEKKANTKKNERKISMKMKKNPKEHKKMKENRSTKNDCIIRKIKWKLKKTNKQKSSVDYLEINSEKSWIYLSF